MEVQIPVVFFVELGLELHRRVRDNCRMRSEIFVILKAIETIADRYTSDSESYMSYVHSHAALKVVIRNLI